MAQVNVTIIGLQRLGASVGLALKQLSKAQGTAHQFTVTGSDDNQANLKAARTMGAIDQDVRDLETSIQKADIVFLASPYSIVKDVLSIIGPNLKPGAVVLDFSPLKMPSINWAREYLRKSSDGKPEAYLIGATPLISSQYLNDIRTETEAARADLFNNSTLVISPSPSAPQEAVQLVVEVADLLGMKVHFTDPIEQDGIVASMEGLPVLLQMALFRALHTSSSWDDIQRLGNPAFALATYRLDQDKAEDVGALIEHNRDNMVRALEKLSDTLIEIADLIRTSDEETIAAAFGDTAQKYGRWLTARQKNKWSAEQDVPAIQRPSLLGPLTGGFRFGKKSSDDKQK